jgi:hypothetical protein
MAVLSALHWAAQLETKLAASMELQKAAGSG